MANFKIPMTGAQIVDALRQLVNRVAEGWAVGTRDGNPVSSSSPYYNNSAKYWAARAQSAVQGDPAGAVRWDIEQDALTTSDQSQARANIKAGASNYNLLRNGWFNVNSRGFTSNNGTNAVWAVDGWYINNGGGTGASTTLNSDNSITLTAGSAYQSFRQIIKLQSDYIGKTFTASVRTANGSYSQSFTLPAQTSALQQVCELNIGAGYLRVYLAATGTNQITCQFVINAGISNTIIAVKLELGTYSTLANDTAPDPEEERARCMMSTADSSDGYANVPYGSFTRPNLLDNSWFFVNQRGATGASSNAYGLDRWLGVGTGYTVNSDGTVTITGALVQRNDWSFVWGKTVTISAMTADESVYSWSGTMSTGAKSIGGLFNATVVSSSQINFAAVSNLKAVKLELGSYSTLANDAPPNYAEELAKCQRYFIRYMATNYMYLVTGFATAATVLNFTLINSLRSATRTVSFSNLTVTNGANSYAVTNLTTVVQGEGLTRLQAVVASGLTYGNPYALQLNPNGYIDISADL